MRLRIFFMPEENGSTYGPYGCARSDDLVDLAIILHALAFLAKFLCNLIHLSLPKT